MKPLDLTEVQRTLRETLSAAPALAIASNAAISLMVAWSVMQRCFSEYRAGVRQRRVSIDQRADGHRQNAGRALDPRK